MIKFKADVDIKGGRVHSVSVSDNYFCPFVEKEEEGDKADQKGYFYCCFYLGLGSGRGLREGVQGCC